MLIDIVNEQVKTEEVVVIVINASSQSFLLEQINKRVQLILLQRQPGSRSLLPVIRLNCLLFKLHPDVIHIHNSTLPAILLPCFYKKMFYTIHALNVPHKYLNRAKCLFAISEAVKADMEKRVACPIVVIPNGIVVEKVGQRLQYEDSKAFKIVQVARLDAKIKGQDILIKAIALLYEKGLDSIYVDFIGEGNSEEELKALSDSLHVGDRVRFLSLRGRSYIYEHLKDYDLMCHPARYEGFGLTVAEAMAAKLPVLVSNEGGPYEIIGKGKYGYAFKMEDVDDCAKQIEYIYKNYASALQKTDAAYQHVVENYSVAKMVQCYVAQYKKYVSR